jgi:hypothetical protein
VNPTIPIYDTKYLAFFVEDKIRFTKLTVSLGSLRLAVAYRKGWPHSGVNLNLPMPRRGRPARSYSATTRSGRNCRRTSGRRVSLAYQINQYRIRSGFGHTRANALVSGTELGGNSLLAGSRNQQSGYIEPGHHAGVSP